MKDKFIVYKHTSPSGKVYIGITCNRPKRRWNNGRGYHYNDYFYSAIKKYGWSNFTHEILYEGLTQDEAEQFEIQLIQEYKSTDRRYGYNHATGGGVNKGYKFTEETKRKLSKMRKGENNHNYGKHFSEEHRRKIGEANSGERNGMYGKPMSKETRLKISKSLKGKPKPPFTKEHIENIKKAQLHKYKPVLCIETGVTYESLRCAERETGILKGCISNVCKGKQRTAGGYTWKFLK